MRVQRMLYRRARSSAISSSLRSSVRDVAAAGSDAEQLIADIRREVEGMGCSVSVIAIDTDPCRAVIARLAAQLD